MWSALPSSTGALLSIEVALIVDDISPSYFAAVGGPIPASDPDKGFSSLLHYMPAHELARAGIPYRNYLLTDLLLPSFQTDILPTLKLVIFTNALRVSAPLARTMPQLSCVLVRVLQNNSACAHVRQTMTDGNVNRRLPVQWQDVARLLRQYYERGKVF